MTSRASSYYFTVILVGVVLGQSLDYFAGTGPVLFGQSVSILIPLGATLISVPMFLKAPIGRCRNRKGKSLLFALFGLWVLGALYTFFDRGGLDYSVTVVGALLVMALLKMPPWPIVERSLDLVFVLIGGLFILAAIWTTVGLAPWDQPRIDWPLLPNLVPSLSRWFAPFTGPGEGGALGAVLITWGVSRRRAIASLLVPTGCVMLFFGGNLASLIATVLGLGVVLGYRLRLSMNARRFRKVALMASGVCLTSGVVVLAADPTLNGRTDIWSSYLRAWLLDPILGIGSRRLGELAMSADGAAINIAGRAPDAHNVFIDTLTRFGPLGLGLLLLASALAVVLAYNGVPKFGPRALVLIVVLLTMGLTESWPRLTSATIPAILFVAACVLVVSQAEVLTPIRQLETSE